MKKFFDYLLHNPRLLIAAIWKRCGLFIPDELYLKVLFWISMGKRLDLKNPRTFSEKLQYLKLYDRKPEYTRMVDKYSAKEYVANLIGSEFIIPTIGVWDKAEDIEWDTLPNQFVLKCTHDSGDLIICKDKGKLDKKAAVRKLNKGLRRDYYKIWREWPYKNVPKRIIAEIFIEPEPEQNDLPDYKFFCFGGEPKLCQVISGRDTKMSIDFFDKDWNHQDFHEPKVFPFAEVEPERPNNLSKMWETARVLAGNIPFSRIDFYEVGNRVLFGEITFFPTSGMGGFEPEDYDIMMGNWIELPNNSISYN